MNISPTEPGSVSPGAASQQVIMAFKRSVAMCRIVMHSETCSRLFLLMQKSV